MKDRQTLFDITTGVLNGIKSVLEEVKPDVVLVHFDLEEGKVSQKVLHIVEAPGGVERYLVTLLKKLKKYNEYEHILVCSSLFDKSKFNGLVTDIEVIDYMHNSISLLDDSKSIIVARKIIKKYKPDIIYCHSSKAGAIGRIADIGIRNWVIYNAHGWSFNIVGASKKKIFFYKLVEKILSSVTDKIVCISEFEKESALVNKICKVKKLIVINNGIDFNEFANLNLKTREDLSIPSESFVVGTIGRLALQKAPDIFIKMATEVKRVIPNSFFIMVGDDIGNGNYREEIETLIRNEGLEDSFLITGWVDNPLDFMGVFDVAVLLSRWEGFGLVLPEYMHMGKPIVATKVDAIPYVLGDAGFLVEVDDFRAAAESIIQLYTDDECRNKFVKKGLERVKAFDAQRMADEHIIVIRELMKNEN